MKKISILIILIALLFCFLAGAWFLVTKTSVVEHGFGNFAVVVPEKISRSRQPNIEEFRWLKNNGYKGVVDLREDNEYGEVADDKKIGGFLNLGFSYLWLPIKDGRTPTDEQVKIFFDFVKNPSNQPVLVHCRAGVGRTGTMIALYRYQIQGWSMDKAIEESRLFNGGVTSAQKKWLYNWALKNPK